MNASLSKHLFDDAIESICRWPNYQATPLRQLPEIAETLGLANIYFKDESTRFGLKSFKALGGAYAVYRLALKLLASKLNHPIDETLLFSRYYRKFLEEFTVTTATDGNHGRSVAWGAHLIGIRCKIYLHENVSAERASIIEALGAEVIRVKGNYDDSVRLASQDADNHGWTVVSDTTYTDYRTIPLWVMAGYGVMCQEILIELEQKKLPLPTHLIIQCGVGALPAAMASYFWLHLSNKRPRIISVEPHSADCLLQSLNDGKQIPVHIDRESMMAGLSCGHLSDVAWEVLSQSVSSGMSIDDALIPQSMRLLHENGIESGESGAAGFAALIASSLDADCREAFCLNENSHVLLVGTEGATDPVLYQKILKADRVQ